MANTMTITFNKYPIPTPLNLLDLSSLFDIPIDTMTLHQKPVRVILDIDDIEDIDEEMRALEHISMMDFWKFEAMD